MSGPRQFTSLFNVVYHGKQTVTIGSTADGAGATVALTVPGAAVGDLVLAAPGIDLADWIFSAYVAAADSVEIRLQNESGTGPTNPADVAWTITVLRPVGV